MAMRVLFAFYPLYVEWNHGIALLSALCKQAGIETGLCLLYDHKKFIDMIQSGEWDVVGFSSTVKADYLKSVPFMEYVSLRSKLHTILGGTYMPLCKDMPPVSRVCYGDGEDLAAYLLGGDTRIFDKPMICHDLNVLPLPDYDLFANYPFDRGISCHEGKKVLPYISSRGCPYGCVFCQTRHQPKAVRIRTRVGEDLREIVDRYHPDMLSLHDALMPYYSPGWRESWGEFRFPFTGYIHAGIKPEELEWLIDRGMVGCAFGIESGDEKFRNEVLNKDLLDDEIAWTINTLKAHDVDYYPFFMTGYPGETFAQRKATSDMSLAVGGHPITYEYEQLGV